MRTWRTFEYYLKLKSVKTYISEATSHKDLKEPSYPSGLFTHKPYSHNTTVTFSPTFLAAMCVHFDARHNLEARHDGNAVLFCWVLFTAIHMTRSCMHHNSKVSKIYQRSCQPSVHKSFVKIMTFLTPTSLHQRGTHCGQKLMDDIVVCNLLTRSRNEKWM